MVKKIIAIFIVLGVLVGGGWAFIKRRGNNAPHPEVKTAMVEIGSVRSTVSATGTLQAFTTVDVKSKAGGKVLKMAVEEGTRVKPGQLICLIDREDNEAVYNQAEADVRSAIAAVQQSQENLKFTTTTLGPQIQQSEESLASAKARLRQAQESLELQKQTSEIQVDEAKHALTAAKARLDQAEQQAKTQPLLTKASIEQSQANVASAEASLKSAEENLFLVKNAQLPQDKASVQATVDQAKSNVETAKKELERLKGLLSRGFASQSQVDVAENQLISAESQLKTAAARLNTLQEEQDSQLREAQIRVDSAKATLVQSRAALTNAQTNAYLDDLRQKDFEAARASYEQAKVSLANAEANRKQVVLKQADVDSAQAAVRQAQASLKNVRANAIQNKVREQDVRQAMARLVRAEVQARNAKTNLDQTTVLAPREGVIVKKLVDEGTIIQSGLSAFSSGSPIVQLADTSRMYVDAQVDEADIALIEEQQEVSITLDAYPNSPKMGKVRKIFPITEVIQNVTYIHVQVEIDPMDVDERLRPGMNATCEFLIEYKENVLTVPSEAVRDVGDQVEVTVIKDTKKDLWDETNQDKRTKIEVGLRGDERTEIIKGLKKGETVVTQIIQPIVAQQPGGMGGPPRGPTGGGRFGR
jgi:HlyD family secretion protein